MPTLIPIRLIPKSERHLVPLSIRPAQPLKAPKPAVLAKDLRSR